MPFKSSLRIALVGDYNPTVTAHRAIPEALRLAADDLGVSVQPEWLGTRSLGTALDRVDAELAAYGGIWLVPASPYADTAAALAAVRFARERGCPFLGTCGGFQHALLEYAAAIWGITNPAHAELDPAAADPVIAPLSCALVEQTGAVYFAPDSRVARLYGAPHASEGYRCRYGLHSRYAAFLESGPLRATAWDADGDVRAVELAGHPFFMATLFQPERAALRGVTPPVVRGFMEAAARCSLEEPFHN